MQQYTNPIPEDLDDLGIQPLFPEDLRPDNEGYHVSSTLTQTLLLVAPLHNAETEAESVHPSRSLVAARSCCVQLALLSPPQRRSSCTKGDGGWTRVTNMYPVAPDIMDKLNSARWCRPR